MNQAHKRKSLWAGRWLLFCSSWTWKWLIRHGKKRKQGGMGMGMGMGMGIMSRVFLISISKPELEPKFII